VPGCAVASLKVTLCFAAGFVLAVVVVVAASVVVDWIVVARPSQ
jgi:hypothetical protein